MIERRRAKQRGIDDAEHRRRRRDAERDRQHGDDRHDRRPAETAPRETEIATEDALCLLQKRRDYSGRRRIVPLNVRTVMLASPRPRRDPHRARSRDGPDARQTILDRSRDARQREHAGRRRRQQQIDAAAVIREL